MANINAKVPINIPPTPIIIFFKFNSFYLKNFISYVIFIKCNNLLTKYSNYICIMLFNFNYITKL